MIRKGKIIEKVFGGFNLTAQIMNVGFENGRTFRGKKNHFSSQTFSCISRFLSICAKTIVGTMENLIN